MSSNKVSIVTVNLQDQKPKSSVGRTSIRPVCVIQADQLKVSFYPDVKTTSFKQVCGS